MLDGGSVLMMPNDEWSPSLSPILQWHASIHCWYLPVNLHTVFAFTSQMNVSTMTCTVRLKWCEVLMPGFVYTVLLFRHGLCYLVQSITCILRLLHACVLPATQSSSRN